MTKLIPTTIFIPVSVENEMPPRLMPININRHGNIFYLASHFDGDNKFYVGEMISETSYIEKEEVKMWLKQQSLFVFDKEQLVKLLGDAFVAGKSNAWYGEEYPNQELYIKNLLP